MKLLSLTIITFLTLNPSYFLCMKKKNNEGPTRDLQAIIRNIQEAWHNSPQNKKQLHPKIYTQMQEQYSLQIIASNNQISHTRQITTQTTTPAQSPQSKKRKKHNKKRSISKKRPLTHQKNKTHTESESDTLETLYYSKNLEEQQLSIQEKDDLATKLYQKYNVTNLNDLENFLENFCERNRIGDYFEQLDESHYIRYDRDNNSLHIVNDKIESKLFEDCLKKNHRERK